MVLEDMFAISQVPKNVRIGDQITDCGKDSQRHKCPYRNREGGE